MVSIADQFRLGHSTMSIIIIDTLTAIYNKLKDTYLPIPTKNDWHDIAEGYWQRWNFPHCIGAIDGKHIAIEVLFLIYIRICIYVNIIMIFLGTS